MTDFDEWVGRVASLSGASSNITLLAREDLAKAKLKLEDPKHAITSLMEDPLAVNNMMGYKDRQNALPYDLLKRIPQQLAIVSAILQTRCNQVASFSVPFRTSKSVGFVIKTKNPGRELTKGEREMIADLERFVYNCGSKDENPHNKENKRDDFETFLKKVVRDSLMYDQMCFEIVPDRRGIPYEFVAVDASTIRLAKVDDTLSVGSGDDIRELPLAARIAGNNGQVHPNMFGGVGTADPYRLMRLYQNKGGDDRPAYVQLWNGQMYNVYSRDELAFGVRNPRTDIYVHGYGYSELEQLITIITAHLYAEEYNRRFFMQGTAPKGILSFKGDTMTPDQLEVFRRQWRAQMEGVQNAWKTPIFQSENGIEWIPLDKSNAEMEYSQWMEYLIKITCGVFLIDPAELNFDLHGGVSQTPLFESSQEWKLKASRDRGLKPLLRFIAKMINTNIIEKIDDHFYFDFVGLDELTEMEKHELAKEQVATYKTLNEIRREQGLTDLPHGNVPMNPTYQQAVQIAMQVEQSQQQAGSPGSPGQPQGGPESGNGEEDGQQDESGAPQYSDGFTKSINMKSGEKYLEISLDDFIDKTRH